MWKELTDLFQNSRDHRKLALKDKLRKINMENDDSIPKHLTKFTHCRDELGSVGITVIEDDMEEIWRNTRDKSSSKANDEDTCALAGKEKKGKGNSSHSKSNSCHGSEKKDMSKVKCFHYHEMGHFFTKCLLKKAVRNPSGGAIGEALASQFELDFTLITCMVSSMMGSVWYLDRGASFHMNSNLEDKDIHMHIEMGDDGRYSATGIGTITFQMELGSPLTLRDFMCVPGLKKNLVSVSMLENRGYDVIFSKGKEFLCHIAIRKVKRIGVRVKNIYKLDVEYCASLSMKVDKVQRQEIDDLWNRRLRNLHHGDLKIIE
eukprot:PITA_35089